MRGCARRSGPSVSFRPLGHTAPEYGQFERLRGTFTWRMREVEGLIATILLALLWDLMVWPVCYKIPRLPRFSTAAMVSVLAFFGYFVTTVYISHGRIMTLVEGVSVFCGLLLFNLVLVSVRAARREHDSNS